MSPLESSPRLEAYGWNEHFAPAYVDGPARGLEPGRVIRTYGRLSVLVTARGELSGHLVGDPGGSPVVGDWVGWRPTSTREVRIEALVPRRSALTRRASGRRTERQIVAANVDRALVVMALDGDFNLRRLERFLVMVGESGCGAIVVLTKADLEPEAETRREEVLAAAGGVPVHLVSHRDGRGLDQLASTLEPGETVSLLGSSGAGKSTLLNYLAGEVRARTGTVRAGDDRGRHTTSHRELFRLPSGVLVIDNPGVREIQPWDAEEGLDVAFPEVEALAESCRFRDCSHEQEPGCAVLAAVESGELPPRRLESYRVLRNEQAKLEAQRLARSRRGGGRPPRPRS